MTFPCLVSEGIDGAKHSIIGTKAGGKTIVRDSAYGADRRITLQKLRNKLIHKCDRTKRMCGIKGDDSIRPIPFFPKFLKRVMRNRAYKGMVSGQGFWPQKRNFGTMLESHFSNLFAIRRDNNPVDQLRLESDTY
jgi:hypothetical protein